MVSLGIMCLSFWIIQQFCNASFDHLSVIISVHVMEICIRSPRRPITFILLSMFRPNLRSIPLHEAVPISNANLIIVLFSGSIAIFILNSAKSFCASVLSIMLFTRANPCVGVRLCHIQHNWFIFNTTVPLILCRGEG